MAVKCGGNRAIISDLSTQTNAGVLSGARRSSRGSRPHYRYAPRSWLAPSLVQDIQFVVLSGLGLGGGGGWLEARVLVMQMSSWVTGSLKARREALKGT